MACQKLIKDFADAHLSVEFVCFFFALRKATESASCQLVSSSSFHRVIISATGHFSPYEDNTKGTRSCPIVLGGQQDYVKPSQ